MTLIVLAGWIDRLTCLVVAKFNEYAKDPDIAISVAAILVEFIVSHLF